MQRTATVEISNPGPFRTSAPAGTREVLPEPLRVRPAGRPRPLTSREAQVLSLVAGGCSNRLIADHLTIAERTVKSHLTNIMTKLRAFDRTHAVVTAFRLGWLSLWPSEDEGPTASIRPPGSRGTGGQP